MKKILSLILAVVFAVSACLALSSCGKTDTSSTDSDKKSDTTTIKIGAVYIGSQNDTAGYTYAHHKGITTAMKSLGLDTKTQLFIVDNVAEDDTEVTNAIDTLANDGCKIIFGISFGYITAFKKAAENEDYKDIIFSHATGYESNDTNFNNYFGRIYQARYLSGIAAGLKSLETKNNELGYVAAYGTEYAETCSGINAFALGAQSVNPKAVVHVKTLGTWGNESKEKQAAQYLVDTDKVGVIAQHCDSTQPMLVAEANKNVYGCGYNSDMSDVAPTSHLTATVWNWNVYYETAIKAAMNAATPSDFIKSVGTAYYGGLKEGLVGISDLTKNCSSGTQDCIDLATTLITSGKWDVFSGVKLTFVKTSDGKYTVKQSDTALLKNDGKTQIVKAGGASVEDSVIKGSMNYYVNGVTEK